MKRFKKLSVILAAVSLLTLAAPISIADASTALPTKQGSFNDVISFVGGKYVYAGSKPGQAKDLYYSNCGTNSAVGNSNGSYAYPLKKYRTVYFTVESKGLHQENLASLSNLTPISAATTESVRTNSRNGLKANIASTKRYGNATGDLISFPNVSEINGSKFTHKWYQYEITPAADATGSKDVIPEVNHYGEDRQYPSKNVLMGFVDEHGNYIDTSSKANLYVFSESAKKMVKVDTFNEVSSEGNVTAKLANYIGLVGQDQDYFYTLIAVTFTGADSQYHISVNDTDASGSYYIQKISKKQGEQKDGVYLPESVTSYEVGSIYYDNDGIDNATIALFTNGEDGTYNPGVNGQSDVSRTGSDIYISQINQAGDKLKVSKLQLVEDTATYASEDGTFSTPVKANFVEKVAGDETSIIKSTPDSTNYYLAAHADKSVASDIYGGIWAVNNGKIIRSTTNNKFEEVYTCDPAIDSIDVYSERDFVAWENNGKVFTSMQKASSAYK